MPADSVAFREFLLFANQKRDESGANIAQPDDSEIMGADVAVSSATTLCSPL
jgi:hypothetical protein